MWTVRPRPCGLTALFAVTAESSAQRAAGCPKTRSNGPRRPRSAEHNGGSANARTSSRQKPRGRSVFRPLSDRLVLDGQQASTGEPGAVAPGLVGHADTDAPRPGLPLGQPAMAACRHPGRAHEWACDGWQAAWSRNAVRGDLRWAGNSPQRGPWLQTAMRGGKPEQTVRQGPAAAVRWIA